jgi:hypothetical protein
MMPTHAAATAAERRRWQQCREQEAADCQSSHGRFSVLSPNDIRLRLVPRRRGALARTAINIPSFAVR